MHILITNLRFKQCTVDQAVFVKHSSKTLIIIIVHVDDCTIAASSLALIVAFRVELSKHIEITDLGELHWLLGIEVTCNREECSLALSQRSYLESIIHHFNFNDLKPVSLPMEPSMKLSSSQSPTTGADFAAMQHIPYHEAVGSLMYAALGTRPNISYAMTNISCFSSNPGMPHWDAVHHIYHYLLGMKDLRMTYGGIEKALVGYMDVDSSMDEDHKVISGYTVLIDGGAMSWSLKKQEIVSLSTTESEYVTATHATKEALWLRSLIAEVFSPVDGVITLFSDNQSTIVLAKDHQYHACTKHIDVHFHFIRWVIDNSKLCLIFCPTNDMVADSLMKALLSLKVKHFTAELGLYMV